MTNSPADPALHEGAAADAQAHRIPAWAPFAFADYRMFWAGSVAATFTNQILILVTAQWLFDQTGSASQLGLLGLVQLVVQIPALLWGGTLADEMDRKLYEGFSQDRRPARL